MNVLVIDGQGGGIGRALVEKLKKMNRFGLKAFRNCFFAQSGVS